MQTPGGVDQHHVGAVGLGRGERVESHRRWVGAHLLTDHRRPGAVGPHLQLVDGRGAERVRRADPDLAARLGELRGEFADGGGLAGAVDAHDHHHVGLALGGVEPEVLRRAVRILHQGGDLLAQDRLQLRGVHVLVPGDALLDAADDLHGGLHAHVRRNEHLFEVVQHVGIDRRAARHGARQFREESRLGLFQPGAELLLLFARLLLGGRRILFLFENIEKCHVLAVNFCKDMNKRGQCQIFILNIAEREYLRRSRRYEKVGKFRRSLRSGRIFRLSESAVTAPTPKVNKNV